MPAGIRPTWDRDSFAARVGMSKTNDLWIIVEGDEVDPGFYGRLANASLDPRIRSARVVPVEQTAKSRDSQPAAGGRIAVLDAHAYYKKAGS